MSDKEYCCFCCKTTCKYSTSITEEGTAYTSTGIKVTATASASACSDISYEDAWLIAYYLAKNEANTIAKNEANIIDQTLGIVGNDKNQ